MEEGAGQIARKGWPESWAGWRPMAAAKGAVTRRMSWGSSADTSTAGRDSPPAAAASTSAKARASEEVTEMRQAGSPAPSWCGEKRAITVLGWPVLL